jgi:hypothetical protein
VGKININIQMKYTKTDENVNESCKDEKTSLEEYIVDANRYHPCPPPKRNISKLYNKYNEIFNERREKLALVLESKGYKVSREDGYTISNIDEMYNSHVEQFSKSIVNENEEAKKLPEVYENFRSDFISLRETMMPKFSEKFLSFEATLKKVVLMREVSDPAELITNLDSKIDSMIDDSTFEQSKKLQEDIKVFFNLFPLKIQETCVDKKEHQKNVSIKFKLIRDLEWTYNYKNFDYCRPKIPFLQVT